MIIDSTSLTTNINREATKAALRRSNTDKPIDKHSLNEGYIKGLRYVTGFLIPALETSKRLQNVSKLLELQKQVRELKAEIEALKKEDENWFLDEAGEEEA